MPENMKNLWENIKEWSPQKKIALLSAIVICLAFLSFIIFKGMSEKYTVLYSNLSEKDAAAVVEKLRKSKVSYKLMDNGRTIMVPQNKVYELRLKLAADNVVKQYDFGFELFDKTTYGMTDFERQVNYQRALQGELERTICQLSNVRSCRVHIVLPKKSVFEEYEEPAKASVVLDIISPLTKRQIKGITNLVAGAVEGLEPDAVTIVDASGNIIYAGNKKEDLISLASNDIELKTELEKKLEKKIKTLLEPIIGSGKVLAKASVELNLKKEESTSIVYDPEKTAIVSEQKKEENSQSNQPMAGGIAGTTSNMPSGTTANTVSSNTISTTTFQNRNYEVSKTTNKIISHEPAIKRISIAVTIDKKRIKEKSTKGEEVEKVVDWTPQEIQNIENIVKAAVGFDASRGDMIVVKQLSFSSLAKVQEEAKKMKEIEKRNMYITFAKYGVLLITILLFFLVVVRPLIRIALAPPEKVVEKEALEAPEEELMLPEQRLKMLESKPYKERIRYLIDSDLEAVVASIRKWINS